MTKEVTKQLEEKLIEFLKRELDELDFKYEIEYEDKEWDNPLRIDAIVKVIYRWNLINTLDFYVEKIDKKIKLFIDLSECDYREEIEFFYPTVKYFWMKLWENAIFNYKK